MKKLLCAGLLSLGLAVSLSASAQDSDYDTEAFCQEFASLVEHIAKLRDGKHLTAEELIKDTKEHHDEENPWYTLRLKAIDIVFTYPKLSPKEEGNTGYISCLDVYG